MVDYVYFFQAGNEGPIKIGYSLEPEKRLENLQGAVWCKLRSIGFVTTGSMGKELEKALHSKFNHLRIRGEWFWPTIELTDFITEFIANFRKVVFKKEPHHGELSEIDIACCLNGLVKWDNQCRYLVRGWAK